MSNEFNIKPVLEHYSCMVNTLGRADRLIEAESLLKHITVKPNSNTWGGLLNACMHDS